MAFARPFAYNPGTLIPGTEQVGNLSIGAPTSGFTNNPQYWNGPDEELGYVIAQSVSGNTQPTPISGVTASVGFFRTEDFTDGSFIDLSETIAQQSFATAADAKTWLNNNGYWTSYESSPVTGYGYNLVVLPYQPPTSGNTIFPTFATPVLNSGTTNPNTFTINGVYWNTIDNLGFDRSSYYNGMSGVSVTAYFTQNGDTATYSGSTTAFGFEGPPGQQAFNYNPQTRPGQLVLIQSASTNFVTGQTVYISYVVN
jgi:hypothetical protein